MVGVKKYKNRFVTSLPVEKDLYERYVDLLPRRINIADEINKFIEERVRDLEAEKNRDASLVVEASPIKSAHYNPAGTVKPRDTTLDEFIKVYEDDAKRMKSIYQMSPEEAYNYATFLYNHLTEVMTIRWKRYKLPSMFKGIYINPKVLDKLRLSTE